MQFLIATEAKPRPRKSERRPWNRLELEHIAIKRRTPLDINDVKSDVIELQEFHSERL
jgi:hypothetical protein